MARAHAPAPTHSQATRLAIVIETATGRVAYEPPAPGLAGKLMSLAAGRR
jgi:hypothetical protein